ncbi:MAG: hypothetical protein HYZ14_04070 [Bacteroidetes bacterium]|nr:hypothetical protein [Bacteroidota bacterium]
MTKTLILILFIGTINFQDDLSIDINSCWLLKEIRTPDSDPIKSSTMDCIPFISPDGLAGCYSPSENEIFINSYWKISEGQITMSYGIDSETYRIKIWNEEEIILLDGPSTNAIYLYQK